MGASNTAMGVGMIVSLLLSGLVMERKGIPDVFYLSGMVCAVALPFFVFLARRGLAGSGLPVKSEDHG